ncbi:MAG: tetratricopeptide repeat protein [candidate division WOR-3 bacterium]
MKVEEILEEVKFYILNHKYEKAEELLKKALSEYPNNEELLYNLGMLYELMLEDPKAEEIYNKILELYPEGKRFKDVKERLKRIEESQS